MLAETAVIAESTPQQLCIYSFNSKWSERLVSVRIATSPAIHFELPETIMSIASEKKTFSAEEFFAWVQFPENQGRGVGWLSLYDRRVFCYAWASAEQ